MLLQRIYGLALGHEDLLHHDQLCSDPVFGRLSGRRNLDKPLAGDSGNSAAAPNAITG